MLGYFSLARSEKANDAARKLAREAILRAADSLMQVSQNTGYGVALAPGDYAWESNETLLHRAAALVFGYELSGDEMCRRAALRQLDYILGLNSLGNVLGGNGAEELALFPDLHFYRDGDGLHLVSLDSRLFLELAEAVGDHFLRMVHGVDVLRGRLDGLLHRDQIVPRVPVRDLDDVADLA